MCGNGYKRLQFENFRLCQDVCYDKDGFKIIMLLLLLLNANVVDLNQINIEHFRVVQELCDDKEECKIVPSLILSHFSKCEEVLS